VNLVRPGRNYGWDPVGSGGGYDESVPMTDLNKFPHAVEAAWSSGPTTTATSGATFLTGPQWGSWRHSMVVAELKASQLRLLTFDRSGVLVRELLIPEFDGMFGRLRTAQLGADGALYVTTSNGSNDKIIRVTAGP
jgi:glucose/arabinose dehydrogenase